MPRIERGVNFGIRIKRGPYYSIQFSPTISRLVLIARNFQDYSNRHNVSIALISSFLQVLFTYNDFWEMLNKIVYLIDRDFFLCHIICSSLELNEVVPFNMVIDLSHGKSDLLPWKSPFLGSERTDLYNGAQKTKIGFISIKINSHYDF